MRSKPVIAQVDTLMCADFYVPIGNDGICPECKIPHDMQSTFIVLAGQEIPPRPLKILIVDDDLQLRGVFTAIFKAMGYEVCEEADGYGAFEHYREGYPFDFVLADFAFIPGAQESSCGLVIRNGADLVREIRKLIPDQLIAIHTGDPETARNALGTSFSDVPILAKPYHMESIEQILNGHPQRRLTDPIHPRRRLTDNSTKI